MKKFLKITGIVIGVILLLLFLTPILFESQIKDLVRKTINENLNAQVDFADIDLSLFRNFPDATLAIEDLQVINNAPFEGDTLARGEEVILEMSIGELFKGSDEPKKIDALALNNMLLNIKVDSLGNANYDIAIESDAPVTDSTQAASGFSFDVQHYEINNSEVNYFDEASKMTLLVEDLNHEGTGDFSAETSNLSTYSTALVSFTMDSTNYLNRNKVELEADFKMDLENMRFTFLENEAKINQLPLTFDGYVQVNEDNNELDLTFTTPSSSFKNFLAVIPEEYSKNIEDVQTSGDFVLNGTIQGIVDETHIPMMDINISSENASFKYPDLPKSMEDISIAVEIKNETGLPEDTYVDINNLNFRIDQDVFNASGSIRNLTENMLVNLSARGTINLANIERAYPLELEHDLNGIVTADLTTSFDMNSVEQEQYQNVKSSGTATIRDFSYASPEIPNEIKIATAQLNFQPGTVSLENFRATTGETDINVTGSLDNLMGYLFTDQKLKGRFNVNSDTFNVNDFMVAQAEPAPEETAENDTSEATEATSEDAIKIPSFLDAQLDFTANRVLYDNLVLENTRGNLQIVNETASLSNVTASIFGGNIVLNGNVSTQEATPNFEMDLSLKAIDIARAFADMELLQSLAPIARALEGNLTTNIDLRGDLNQDLTPQLQTLAGNALAEVLGARVNPTETPLLANLDSRLTFIDLNNLNLNDLKTQLTFNNGRVEVQPFNFNIKGINATASGSHGFDMSMDYNVSLDIPAKYLGGEVGNTLSRLTSQQMENTTVSLPVGITGSFQNPNINLNLQKAVTSLSQKIIDEQKDDLKEKGRDILGNILGGKKQPQDTTAAEQGQQRDTTTTREETVKDAARKVLGGILGGQRKKQDTTGNN
ncbi:AsmA-like C-terminal region-containing protein [Salinimicrobium sp. GXAS 041]|uniref:AsmA family protein n=1 Tax=Salinimicrobium sp. GXAS 041 TaxID=3400806 RepID=UPI003C79339D